MTDAPMDERITKAIAAVMADVPKLAKGEKNSHGNYNFASIDDFLEAVRPLMAKAGLVISSNEEDFEVIGEGREAWLKMRFAFEMHAAGASFGPLYRTTMVRASMGSQAFGAAQSYAEKQFLRSLFKIATGEGAAIDADSHAQSNLPSSGRAHVTEQQRAELEAMVTEVGADLPRFLRHLKVSDLSALSADRFDSAMQALAAKKKEAK